MTHRQRPRARFIPTEHGDEEAQHQPEPRVGIKYPIHYWSVWKGLTRRDQQRDTRIVAITDTGICEWARAFTDERACWLDCHVRDQMHSQLEVRQYELWEVLEKRLENADPKRAFMMMAGMASEVAWRIEHRDDSEKFQIWQDFKDLKMWGTYRWHFGDPTNPRMEMFL